MRLHPAVHRIRPMLGEYLFDPRKALVAVILVTGVVVLILRFTHYAEPLEVSGEIVAGSVTVMLPNGLALEPSLPLDGRRSIRLSGYTAGDGVAAEHATLRSAYATELSEVNLAPGATLSMMVRPVGTRSSLQLLGFKGASLAIDQMGPGEQIGAGGDADDGPSLVRVSTAPDSPVPLRMQAMLGGPDADETKLWPRLQRFLVGDRPDDTASWSDQFSITNVAISDLRFGQESPGQGSQTFVSSIKSGEITLIDVEKTMRLGAASPLAMTGLNGTLTRLVLQADGFHVLFSGKLDSLSLGLVGFPKDQRPTMLDFLLNNPLMRAIMATIVWSLATIGPAIYSFRKA